MQKVDGVQSVQVSLKQGTTTLDLRPDNKVTLARLRTVIKNNGFVSRDAIIVAVGTVQGSVFEVAGTGERLPFTGKATPAGEGRWQLNSPAK